jgi:iron complex transport system substrate-binding protein
MHRTVKILSVVAAGLLALSACGGGASDDAAPIATGAFPMTVTDCGRQIILSKRPERVLTMGSVAATLMWAAGATDKITARANEGNVSLGPAEQALQKVPLISPNQELSQEVIIGQRPDLVISYGLNMTTWQDLEAAGIHSVVNAGFCDGTGSGPNPDGDVDFDDVYADIELYGRIVGTDAAALRTVADLRRRVGAIQDRFRTIPSSARTAAALTLSGGSVRAYGFPNMTHAQIEALGLTDVFADIKERVAEVSVEELITRDPDFLILLAGGAQSATRADVENALQTLPGIDRLAAVREGRYILLESPFLLGSPLAVDGLEAMAQKLTTSS